MSIGLICYFAGACAFLFLTLLLISSWRGRTQGAVLIFASSVTVLWAGTLGIEAEFGLIPPHLIWPLEILHSAAWLFFLTRLLISAFEANKNRSFQITTGILLLAILALFALQFGLFPAFADLNMQVFGHVILAIIGLVLIEQLYRNTRYDQRWNIKFLCFALGGLFAYNFYLFSDALLFQKINPDIWAARGAIVAMLMPFIAIAVARNPDWSLDIFISRGVVFHSATLLGSGAYLLLMAIAGYYIKIYGGEWGRVAQIVFLMGAFLVLALLLFSGQIRARLRVFLSKHFFSYAYDYRKEWLDMIATLSETSGIPLEERVILALAQLVESPSGVLWVREADQAFYCRAGYGDPEIEIARINADDPMLKFIADSGWVINLSELERVPELYPEQTRPAWLGDYQNPWLLIPLFQGSDFFGMVLLTKPRTPIDWNWEVIDLLKTAACQIASYLALEDAAAKLAEVKQFEGFNRLSAFVIHDLKNLIAQLTLVVRNAERHQNNPAFMQDAIATIDHAVAKMNRLMSQLRYASVDTKESIDINELLQEIVHARMAQSPIPNYLRQTESKIAITADRDRLASAFEHVIQNAQEAAGKKGRVHIRLSQEQEHAVIEVEDSGPGMDEEFIRKRLFKPFDTTKGLTGMGIGAYESREYIRTIGGELKVTSVLNEGTVFRFIIPLARETSPRQLSMEKASA